VRTPESLRATAAPPLDTGVDITEVQELPGQRIEECSLGARALAAGARQPMEVHPKYLGSVERGRQNSTLDPLFKLVRALRVETAGLFNYTWRSACSASAS
jgi:hypothetical protein